MQAVVKVEKYGGHELTFSDEDVVEYSDWIPGNDRYNPHSVRPWLLHDHGFTLAVCFADCLQDAIDKAVDAGKLDRFQISPEELASDYDNGEDERVSYLGNAGEPFDIETLDAIELPNPPFSFAAAFMAAFPCDRTLVR